MMVQSTTGPVDLSNPENFRRGMVLKCPDGGLVTFVPEQVSARVLAREVGDGFWRFIGLSAALAREADMERLCCGAHRNKQQPVAYLVDAARCTLAIGHNGDHEALASGVKWAATPEPPKRVQVTLAALLKEFDGRQRDHDPRTRGARILACLPHNQAVRDLAKHLETLGGTWHPGSRIVKWPGGSWVCVTTADRADEYARGLRVDVLVGTWSDPWGVLDQHGLRMMVSAPEAPAFWGMRSLNQKVASMVRGMAYRDRAGVFARGWEAVSFHLERAESVPFEDAAEHYASAARCLAGLQAIVRDAPDSGVVAPRGNVVMAGTPRRQGGLLYGAAQVATERSGKPRVLTLSMGTIRIGEHDVECQVRRREDGQMEVTFPAHPAVRVSPQVDRYEVTIGGEKVMGIVLSGEVMFDNPTVHLTLREWREPRHSPMPALDRLPEWTDGLTRQLHARRKALAGQTSEARMLTKALRAALPDVDRLPWDLVDRRPLHAAAHALCEMAEAATDGGGNGSTLRPMLGEMLGILRAAEHLPPATARQMAERTLDAARKAWPRGKK